VPLYLKRGTAPTTKCPKHGGEGSISDSKAPTLIKIAQDHAIINEIEETLENGLLANADEIRSENKAQRQSAVLPVNAITPTAPKPVVRYVEASSKNADVEDRFQELIKEYGIVY
jgi:hypothetical protein